MNRGYYTSFELPGCRSKLRIYLHEFFKGQCSLCTRGTYKLCAVPSLHHVMAVVDHERPSVSDHRPLNFVSWKEHNTAATF